MINYTPITGYDDGDIHELVVSVILLVIAYNSPITNYITLKSPRLLVSLYLLTYRGFLRKAESIQYFQSDTQVDLIECCLHLLVYIRFHAKVLLDTLLMRSKHHNT